MHKLVKPLAVRFGKPAIVGLMRGFAPGAQRLVLQVRYATDSVTAELLFSA
jgi:hypothetical protein